MSGTPRFQREVTERQQERSRVRRGHVIGFQTMSRVCRVFWSDTRLDSDLIFSATMYFSVESVKSCLHI